MRKGMFWTILGLGLLAAWPVQAYDRYLNGRRLFRRRCGVCLSMGWVWDGRLTSKQVDLARMAATWSAARVCTWLHRQTKKIQPPGCYPGRIRFREKLAILYYLWRRAQGPIHKPVLGPIYYVKAPASFRVKAVTPGRRRFLMNLRRNKREANRWRRWIRRWRSDAGARPVRLKAGPASSPRRTKP